MFTWTRLSITLCGILCLFEKVDAYITTDDLNDELM